MLKLACIGILGVSLFGCVTATCLDKKTPQTPATATNPPSEGAGTMNKPESKLDKVKVYKADGSLQCGQGKALSIQEMQKELKNIKVYSSANKNDGLMRIQVCGAPTGNSNVYEIDGKDLEAALKLGFKQWTFDN